MLTPKKKKHVDGKVNTDGWMMSYADMATTLLAMFIVLSTMGKDQTGVNLYNGTGSFFHALSCFGMPGLFPNSSQVIQFDSTNPKYQAQQSDLPNQNEKHKGDDKGDPQRVIDAEQDRMQRFVNEMDRQFRVDKLPKVMGQASVDVYEPFEKKAPFLKEKHLEVLWPLRPALAKPDYRVAIIVWAATPTESAWQRACEESQVVLGEAISELQVEGEAKARITAYGQTWRYANVRRPVMSVVIMRTTN